MKKLTKYLAIAAVVAGSIACTDRHRNEPAEPAVSATESSTIESSTAPANDTGTTEAPAVTTDSLATTATEATTDATTAPATVPDGTTKQ